MTRYGASSLATRLASASALVAGLDHNRVAVDFSRMAGASSAVAALVDQSRVAVDFSRMAGASSAVAALVDQSRVAVDFSQLMTPRPVLGVDFPRLEFPVPAFPKFESPPALIGIATPPGAIDLLDNSAILAGFSPLRDALTTVTAAFEHSGIREMIDGIVRPSDSFIPKFSISAYPEFKFKDVAFQDHYDDLANALCRAWIQKADIGSRRPEDRRAVHIVIKGVGKGLLFLVKWGGVTVATIVAKHYLEPYLLLLPQP